MECSDRPFSSYTERLNTFKLWRGKIESILLADAGFYYGGLNDKCICFFCEEIIGDWKEGETPWLVHRARKPGYIFIQMNSNRIDGEKKHLLIDNHLNSNNVKSLVDSGRFKLNDVSEALERNFVDKNCIPLTIDGIIDVTEKYWNSLK